jgi:hypothetical protein
MHGCGTHSSGGLECWGLDLYGSTTLPGGNFISLAMSPNQTCGIRPSGFVECWGMRTPTQPPPRGRFQAIAVGNSFACAIERDDSARGGALECWGDLASPPPTGAPEYVFSSISAGYDHACAISAIDGWVECWGNDDEDQASPPAGAFKAVSAGFRHTCGIREDDAVECWGGPERVDPPPTEPAKAVFAGAGRDCAILMNDELSCFGDPDASGKTPPEGPYESLVMGGHTCGLLADGRVRCWYQDESSDLEVMSPDGFEFQSVVTGGWTYCGLHRDQTAHCFSLPLPEGVSPQ